MTTFARNLYILAACCGAALFLLAFAVGVAGLSHLVVAYGIVIILGGYVLGYLRILRAARAEHAARSKTEDDVPDEAARRKLKKQLAHTRTFLILLIVSFPFGLLQPAPLFARVVAGGISVFLMSVFVQQIVRIRKDLNELDPAKSTPSNST